MNDRTLVKLRCNKEILDIRTVSWTRKSPRSFSILRSELQQLEQRPKNRLISSDCGSFAVLRLTQGPDGVKMLEIRFTWLQEIGAGKVHGWQESIRLPYEPFHVFVENGEDMDGAEWRHLSVPETVTPRYEFHSRKNLHEVARRPVLRRKLGRVLSGISSGVAQKRLSFMMTASLTASFLKNTRLTAEGSAAASSWIAPRIWQRPSTALIPKLRADFV